MAASKATKPATKKPGTAVVPKKATGTALVNMKDAITKELAELQDRVGAPGGDVIYITQDKQFKLPDGTEIPAPLKSVIVDFVTHRFYYDRDFDPKTPCPPACFAISVTPKGMVPNKASPDVQSKTCDGCPMNEYGSATKGDGKACKEMRALAILPDDADVNTEINVVKTSPTALKPFDSYVTSIARTVAKAPWQIITDIGFDDNLKYPSLRFTNPQPADDDLVAAAFSQREKARARLLAPPDVSNYQPYVAKGKPAKSARK